MAPVGLHRTYILRNIMRLTGKVGVSENWVPRVAIKKRISVYWGLYSSSPNPKPI